MAFDISSLHPRHRLVSHPDMDSVSQRNGSHDNTDIESHVTHPSSSHGKTSTTVKPQASKVAVVSTILAWFLCNGGLLISNKYLMATGFKDRRLPLSLTCCHMMMSTLATTALIQLGYAPHRTLHDRRQVLHVLYLAIISGLSIVLGIMCLGYIALSLEQAVGATTPFFTALISLVVLNKRESNAVYGALAILVSGTLYASHADPIFNLIGFLMAVFSTVLRGGKSVMQEMLMSHDANKLDAVNLLRFSSMMVFGMLLPIALLREGVGMFSIVAEAHALGDTTFNLVLLSNCLLAAFTNFTQFLLTKLTSAITSQVVGNTKSAVLTVVSILIFGNPINVHGVIGYLTTFVGAGLYTHLKNTTKAGK